MIYCDTCAAKEQWPTTQFRKLGACEHCGKVDVCSHTPYVKPAPVVVVCNTNTTVKPAFPLEVRGYKPGDLMLGQVGHVYEGKSNLGITMKILAAERQATADGHEPNTEAWRNACMKHLNAMMPPQFDLEMPLDTETVQRVINTHKEFCDDRR